MPKNTAKVKFTAETGDFNAAIKKSNDEMAKLRAELRLNETQSKATGATIESLEEKHKLLSSQLATSQDKTEALNQKIEKAVEIFGENSTEVTRLKTQLASAQVAEEKIRQAIDACNTELEDQRRAAGETEDAHETLTETISRQQKELDDLKADYVEVVAKYGDTSDEAKALERSIGDLSSELKQNKAAFSDASDKADSLDNSLDDVEESAEDAGEGFTVMKGAMADLVANGISTLISGIRDAISGFMDLSEETQEYREDINKLNTAFERAGYTTKQAKKVYKELYSVFGEEDRAVEASQQIANISKNEEDMARMTEIATGAWARWGDSLATESLMEAISESAKLSSVQGTLADALNWAAEEGEMFGLTLLENIDFTELSAKEIEKLTEQQKKEYEARKKQYESIEEYNQKITDASETSELFTIALENCADEEERTALILDTLEGMYSDSAKLYKENNKNIIKSRKASSDYNDVLAEMGEELEPVNTEIKELGTKLLKNLAPTVKRDVVPAFEDFVEQLDHRGVIEGFSDLVGDLAEGALPVLADVLEFAVINFDDLVIGIGAAVVAFETMSVVGTVTEAVKGATTAMGAFNAIMAANPIGAVTTAVGILAVGVLALSDNTEDAIDTTELFTIEELELYETVEATSESIQETKKSVEEMSGTLTAEKEHTEALADELFRLADESGKVKEADETRAQFILNELNDALGTEYEMVDGVIQKYDTLQETIYDVINAKTANALLEAKNEEYVVAIENEKEALQTTNEAYDVYQEHLASSQQAEEEYLAAYEEWQDMLTNCKLTGDYTMQYSDTAKVSELKRNADEEKAMLDEAEQKYNEAAANYASCQNSIIDYENASMLVQEGNYEEAIAMLQNKGDAYFEYSDDVSQATRDAVDALYEEAVQAGIEADRTKRNFEKGVKGYTEEMVDEAEKGYEDALNEWANAYSDANSVGKDLSGGLSSGMESQRSSLLSKARSIVSNIISAMRSEADSHSPSRKTIAFGEDLGEGAEIGIDNKTDDVVKSAENQIGEIIEAYNSELAKPMLSIGGFDGTPIIQRDITNTVEHNINNIGLASLASAISDLANRPVELYVNDVQFATATASASDSVNGLRSVFRSRGLVLD